MANKFFLKAGDTYPFLRVRLETWNEELNNGDGGFEPINLTDCSVKFRMSREGSGNDMYFEDAEIVYPDDQDDATKAGIVEYQWKLDATETSIADDHQAEWRITLPSTRVMTIPRGEDVDLYNIVTIQELVS